jgi:protein tyrosine phosphatase (PTP) superfamily phosphohydrolase (DUF442 family)
MTAHAILHAVLASTPLLALVGCAESRHVAVATPTPAAATRAPSAAPPSSTAEKAAHLPGLGNVVTYTDSLVCGALPEGDAGFASLAAMGIRTVVSVDGATPEVDLAARHGLRYVHLPISYDGVPEGRAKELAQAVASLPGPIYMHCHHGKHRSASALGTAAVLAGRMTPEQAAARMKVSGTASEYAGLWSAVRNAKQLEAEMLRADPTSFVPVSKVTGMVATMSEVDLVFDNLKAVDKAGYAVPKDHPDLVPSKESRHLRELFASLEQDPESQKYAADYQSMLRKSIDAADALDVAIRTGDAKTAQAQFAIVGRLCKECHKPYRDN